MGIRIGIDLMGSDRSPVLVFNAVLQALEAIRNDHTFVVIARHDILPELRSLCNDRIPTSIECITTDESIEMDEHPLLAIRRKKNSSMAAGMRLLKEKKIDAFVSTGNTGALIGTAMLHLPMLPSVERPALMVMLPTGNGKVAVLDVGANLSPKPEHLLDYAKLGSLYRKSCDGLKEPTVGLLNVGVEEEKGTAAHKETYQLLQKAYQDRFLGNIEGREVFEGKIDVLVTDGFTGNVFLKTCEGVSSFLTNYLHLHFASHGSPESQKIVSHLYNQFNYSEHPGGLLCGVDGIVIKCHGYSNESALKNGIIGAISLAENHILEKMKSELIL